MLAVPSLPLECPLDCPVWNQYPMGTQEIPFVLLPRNYLKVQQVRQHQPPLWERTDRKSPLEPSVMDSCKLTGTQNPQVVKETTERQAAGPNLLNLPLEFQFLWFTQLPEASLCPNGCDCPTAQPWSSLVWGWSSPGGVSPCCCSLGSAIWKGGSCSGTGWKMW